MKLVLATRNAHKAREFATLLAPHEVVALPEDVRLPPAPSRMRCRGTSHRSRAAARATGMAAIADDSGIEAAVLGGAPGVRSARFAGERATDDENLEKLLGEAPTGSELAYVCALVLVRPDGELEHTVQARCTGTLAAQPRGNGGFGYDPAFLPDDIADGRTMAELEPREKDAISHRGRAARELLALLETAG